MGLCETSNFSIFISLMLATSYVYRMMRFKGSNGKVCKMTLWLDPISRESCTLPWTLG